MEDDSGLAIFEPWVILPDQVAGGGAPWASNSSGQVALMLAVLEDAVRCIEQGRRYRNLRIREAARRSRGMSTL